MRRIGIAVWVLLVIALAGLPAGVQAEGDDDGLVAEWHFDEGSGSVLADSSGNGNDGVIHGASWVDGKYGKALSFDGEDDYISQKSLFHNVVNTFTTELWVSPSAVHQIDSESTSRTLGTSGQRYAIWPPQGDASYGASNAGAGISIGTNGVSVYEHAAHYMPPLLVHSGAIYSWTHVVVVYENKQVKLYLNGNLIRTGTSPKKYIHPSGQIGGGSYGYFNGIIDEVRIYNRALTAEEIKQHYEGEQTALSLTKSASPHSIKQGQTTTVTLTVTNTGTTGLTDIEVSDTIPSDLIFVSGETSKRYDSLRPKDSREFQYTIQPSDAGAFNLDPATATYSDEEGNYHTAESKTATITVIPSTNQPATPKTAPKSSTEISTASVHLHGEKTDVVLGEDVLLKLSAVNIIGNPLMRVQVIIIPPSGWSVTSSEFAKSGAGQYTTTYDIKEGVGRDIEVRIMPNQIGDDFQVQGRIIYYFGDDSDAREDHTLTLPITVRAEAENGRGAERTADTSGSEENGASTPGFAAVVAVIGLLAAYLRRRI